MFGAIVSRTVTVNVLAAEFLKRSVAVTDTSVTPIGNGEPDAGLVTMIGDPSTASRAATLNVTTAPAGDVASATTSATSMAGAVVSTTVTPNCAFATFPCPSSALQFTAVHSPTGKSDGEVKLHVTTTAPATVSNAVIAGHATSAPSGPVASIVRCCGTLRISGAVVSRTDTFTA